MSQTVKFQSEIQAYEEVKDEISRLLKQIHAGLDVHDKRASSRVGGHTWGHVGDLNAIAHELKEIKDRLHLTGEYSKTAILTKE